MQRGAMNSKRPLQDDEVSDTGHPKRPNIFDIISHGSHGGVPLSPDHYTVGWIAALPIERAAVTALLDERHHEPQGFSQNPSDTNSYTWARMEELDIVIASLPAGVYGTKKALRSPDGEGDGGVEDDDAKTTYSAATTVAQADTQHYISELSYEIAKKLGVDVDVKELAVLRGALPELIKASFVKLGLESTSQISRDIMYFVHKHHR